MCLETDFRARSERRVTEALEDKECVQVKAKATVVRADFARVYTIMMLRMQASQVDSALSATVLNWKYEAHSLHRHPNPKKKLCVERYMVDLQRNHCLWRSSASHVLSEMRL